MRTLNLACPESSDIKFTIQKFPDGQQNIVVLVFSLEPCEIRSRLNNFKDLELIICAVQSLRELGISKISLYCPYFLGSRSDRKFEVGGNNYLKTVICPIINSLNFTSVTVLDPHSDVLESCLNNFKKIDNYDLVYFALEQPSVCGGDLEMLAGDGEDGEGMEYPFYMRCEKCGSEDFYNEKTSSKGCTMTSYKKLSKKFALISPDAGANKKIYNIADKIGYKGEIITCSKHRDEQGKLGKTVLPSSLSIHRGEDLIIIDDICDGGRTFINIAEAVKKAQIGFNSPSKLFLIVTHGIFSQGFEELAKYFTGIYCTNSYSNLNGGAWLDNKTFYDIHQLNVF